MRERVTMRRVGAAIAMLAFVAACGGSDAPTGPKDVSGTYALASVDALALPFSVPSPREHVIVINTVSATLNANGTYAVAGTGTQDGNASTVLTDAGTFTRSGATIHFASSMFAAQYTGKAKTDTITVTLPGGFVDSNSDNFSLVFVKGS